MRIRTAVVGLALITTTAMAAPTLKTQEDKLSYTIGVDLGANFKKEKIPLQMDAFKRGLADGLSGTKPALSEKEMKKTLSAFQKKLMADRQKKFRKLSKENAAAGEAYLVQNKKKTGVVTLADGLQFKVIKEGSGAIPTEADNVTVNYRGTFVDGKEFDSSYKRGKPVTFAVNEVIPGWTEILQKMKTGSIYEVVVPAKLAYGAEGVGSIIGPNETLVYKIELLKVTQPKAKK